MARAGVAIVAGLAWAMLAGCAAPAGPVASASVAVPFVDAHAHLNDESMLVELMDTHGVERAVVFWGRASDNDGIAAAATRHPDRFIAFASISPERARYRAAWTSGDSRVLDELDALLATGRYRGIGEISAVHFPSPGFPEADFDPDGPLMHGLLALARRYRVPVLLHVEWTRLDRLKRLLERHRDVAVIWAHGGYTPLFIAERMLAKHPNLTYELSARTWPEHPRSPDYTILRNGVDVWPRWLALIEAQPHRFVVGSDAAQRSRATDAARLASVQAFLRQLTPATRAAVARENLLRLVGLAPR